MNVGDRVESFALSDQHGTVVSLDELLAEGRLVLYFYIKAKTPG